MDRNVKIAKELIRIAKDLMAAPRDRDLWKSETTLQNSPSRPTLKSVASLLKRNNGKLETMLQKEIRPGAENFATTIEFAPAAFYDQNNNDNYFGFTFDLNPYGEYAKNGANFKVPKMSVKFHMNLDGDGNIHGFAYAYFGNECVYSSDRMGETYGSALTGAWKALQSKYTSLFKEGLKRIAGEDLFVNAIQDYIDSL